MPAARYWRIRGVETYIGGDLLLSEVALHQSSGRADASATITSTAAPIAGTLDSLKDNDLGTTVRWSQAAAFLPGFEIHWDLGAEYDLTKISVAGPDQELFLHKFRVESSTDNISWGVVASTSPATKWRGAADYFDLNLAEVVAGDPFYENVSLLLRMNGVNGGTTFTDESLSPKVVTAVGNAQVSTAQSKFGGTSAYFDGSADRLSTATTADFGFGSGDFCWEAWIYPTALSGGDKAITDFRTGASAPLTSGAVMFLDSAASFTLAFWDNTAKYGATGSVPAVNAWSHVAITRNGTTIRGFLNGVQQWSATHSKDLGASNYIGVGASSATPILDSSPFAGYMDDLRITKGVARYTANFTPPVTTHPPLTGGSSGDLYASNVALLLNMNGVNGSTTFTDESLSPKVVTAFGGAQVSTAQSKFGGASAYFDGSGDYLYIPSTADFGFGTGDFTIEAWVKTSSSAGGVIVDTRTSGSEAATFYINTTTGVLGFFINSSQLGTISVIDGNWHHIVWCRGSGVMRMFVDGVQDYSASVANDFGTSRPLWIASQFGGSLAQLNGYIDDLRITKGVARYTANFTPPTSQLVLGDFDRTPLRLTGNRSYDFDLTSDIVGNTVLSLEPLGATTIDLQDGGTGRIVGTVKEKALPANIPLRRRVLLFNYRDHRQIRETWSDAVTGDYVFNNIDRNRTYTVVSYDHTGFYRAVIADNLAPEPMP